jgi:hypothetical protein
VRCRFPKRPDKRTSQTVVLATRYGERVGDRRRIIDLDVRLGGEQVTSATTAVRAGPDVLNIITVLPDHGVLFQLVSTFIGHKGVDTHIAHLVLGPLGEDPAIHTEDRPHELLDPAYDPRGCVYEHIHVLMEHLRRLGHEPTIDVPDDAFRELERVEH